MPWGCKLEEEEAGSAGWYRSKQRWWVPIGYPVSIVTFPLSLRVSEILSLLFSRTPLFPTPPIVFPKFPHVPLEVGGWRLGYEERRGWANCREFSFQDCQRMWSWSTNVIDGQTTCHRRTALCTIVHRAVKISEKMFPDSTFDVYSPIRDQGSRIRSVRILFFWKIRSYSNVFYFSVRKQE